MIVDIGKERDVFGVPAVLTEIERTVLMRDLAELWHLTYGQEPAGLDTDLKLCSRFFDPLARGRTLRERLAQVPEAPSHLLRGSHLLGEPVVLNAGERTLVVGVEARLVLHLLQECQAEDGHVVISPDAVASVVRIAMAIYRSWTMSRLSEVIALRAGQGREVMQSVSVGLVIALLVNRSDAPERAVAQRDHTTMDGRQVDSAIHAGAERFAEVLSPGRGNRSASEQRLKGGYPITEAHRRLAHRLVVTPDGQGSGKALYVPAQHRDEVVAFLARDLARRPTLELDTLAMAFDELVAAFRAAAGQLAERSMAFDRSADTRALKQDLLDAFANARTARRGPPA